ncbi:SPOR domain-containing protein [Sphingomonas desiccabilis]|uniref:SPOR domain-containing protein n=1 Tax=Sphingomonas desiccabilis TaxID=429134 RepID=A0A4Q2IXD4_9SPHN|nr:SPOR domain-containing protein [Sphingomonas desiccabilis]MBB3910682.1 rare lipoprotein A [Sphingomonas desiccabilis]RXZ35305.1 hypothetical protein EO081_06665 [Sphingomonas desiccabilis]
MKSHVSALAALLLAACATSTLPPAPQQPAGDPALPAAPPTSEARYDAVGWAATAASPDPDGAVFVVHPTLAEGSFVELTLLDGGRTTVMKVGRNAPVAPGYLLALSPVAAQALGAGSGPVAVRAREVVPPLQERAAAEGGSLTRMDAPQLLLAALRKRLPPVPAAGATPAPSAGARPASAPEPAPRPGPAPIETVDLPPSRVSPLPSIPASPEPAPVSTTPASGAWVVQVAALSNAARAEALARELGGFTRRTGALVRVRMGPYPTTAAAERGRAQAAARGYGDAKVIRND